MKKKKKNNHIESPLISYLSISDLKKSAKYNAENDDQLNEISKAFSRLAIILLENLNLENEKNK